MIELFINTGIQLHYVKYSDDMVQKRFGVGAKELLDDIGGSWVPSNLRYVRIMARREEATTTFAIAIDTRLGPINNGYVADDPELVNDDPVVVCLLYNGISVELAEMKIVKQSKYGKPIPISLILDVGNSRTVSCTIEMKSDGYTGPKDFNVLGIKSLRNPFDEKANIFESTLEFTSPVWDTDEKHYIYNLNSQLELHDRIKRVFKYHPFIRVRKKWEKIDTFNCSNWLAIGKDAVKWRQAVGHVSTEATGLSSPKRYLWADKNVDHIWSYGKIKNRVEEEDQLIPVKPPRDWGKHFPKKYLMSLYLYELFNSVFSEINSPDKQEQIIRGFRFIKDIVLTYPSSMSLIEKNAFKEQAETAVKMYLEYGSFKLAPKVHLSVDEGVASAVCYLSQELQENNGSFDAVVSKYAVNRNKESISISCFDFGGGTIDVAITNIEKSKERRQLACNVVATDGVYIGVDDLLREIVKQIIIPKMQEVSSDKQALESYYSGKANVIPRPERVRFIRELFLPIALEIVRKAEHEEEKTVIRVSDLCSPRLLKDMDAFLIPGSNVSVLEGWSINYSQSEIRGVIEKVYSSHIKSLIEVVLKYKPDLLVITGRCSRITHIKNIIASSLKDTNCRLIAMSDHMCQQGDDVDPKLSVVIGASTVFLSNNHIAPGSHVIKVSYDARKNFIWGFIDPTANVFSKDKDAILFRDNKYLDEFEMAKSTYFIGRANNGVTNNANPVYRLTVNNQGTLKLKRQDVEMNEEIDEELVLTSSEEIGTLNFQTYVENNYWLDGGSL